MLASGGSAIRAIQVLKVKLKKLILKLMSSVLDPWHFGADPDAGPDPQIHTSDQGMRIRTKIFSEFFNVLINEI